MAAPLAASGEDDEEGAVATTTTTATTTTSAAADTDGASARSTNWALPAVALELVQTLEKVPENLKSELGHFLAGGAQPLPFEPTASAPHPAPTQPAHADHDAAPPPALSQPRSATQVASSPTASSTSLAHGLERGPTTRP